MKKAKQRNNSTTNSHYLIAAIATMTMSQGSTNTIPILTDNFPPQQERVFELISNATRATSSDRFSLQELKFNKKKLNSFKQLQSDWNGYDGEPIPLEVIESVEKIITKMDFQPSIFPTGRGSVQIEYFRDDDNKLEIEISSDEVYVYRVDNGIEWEGETTHETVPEIANNFYA